MILVAVARTTNSAVRAGGTAHEGSVHFSGEIISASGSFAPGQALSFGSLDYAADRNDELHIYEETLSEDNESPSSHPLLGLLGANLEVLTRQVELEYKLYWATGEMKLNFVGPQVKRRI